MSNPYIPTQGWFDEYRQTIENYDYANGRPWPDDCPVWRVLAPGEGFPYRRWADHQVTEISSNPYELPVYACHPYHLDTDALQDLLALERAGFTVKVTGYSEYHPTAIRVEIHPTRRHFHDGGPVDYFDAAGRPVREEQHG